MEFSFTKQPLIDFCLRECGVFAYKAITQKIGAIMQKCEYASRTAGLNKVPATLISAFLSDEI